MTPSQSLYLQALLVKQYSENPCVGGSIPPLDTIIKKLDLNKIKQKWTSYNFKGSLKYPQVLLGYHKRAKWFGFGSIFYTLHKPQQFDFYCCIFLSNVPLIEAIYTVLIVACCAEVRCQDWKIYASCTLPKHIDPSACRCTPTPR